jgi:hypothetical protein
VNDPDFYRINEDAGLEHIGPIGGSIPGRVFSASTSQSTVAVMPSISIDPGQLHGDICTVAVRGKYP